jgi:hypothetical protein
MKDTIASKAKANGINPQTARNRIQKGWTVAEATTRPMRGYRKTVEKRPTQCGRTL